MAGIELTKEQLDSLDELISKMEANPKMNLGSVEEGRAITTVVVTAIFVATALGADATVSQPIKDVISAAKKVSLEDLLDLRRKAIVKK